MLIQYMLTTANLIVAIQSHEPEKIQPVFENDGITPKHKVILMKFTPSDSAYQKTLL